MDENLRKQIEADSLKSMAATAKKSEETCRVLSARVGELTDKLSEVSAKQDELIGLNGQLWKVINEIYEAVAVPPEKRSAVGTQAAPDGRRKAKVAGG